VAKRKSLFDDKADEIQQLTFVIKQDIGTLNKQIAQLQEVSSSYFWRLMSHACSSVSIISCLCFTYSCCHI